MEVPGVSGSIVFGKTKTKTKNFLIQNNKELGVKVIKWVDVFCEDTLIMSSKVSGLINTSTST